MRDDMQELVQISLDADRTHWNECNRVNLAALAPIIIDLLYGGKFNTNQTKRSTKMRRPRRNG